MKPLPKLLRKLIPYSKVKDHLKKMGLNGVKQGYNQTEVGIIPKIGIYLL